MCSLGFGRQHKLLLHCTRRLLVGRPAALYHEDGGVRAKVRRLGLPGKNSRVPHKPVVPDGWKDQGRPAPSKAQWGENQRRDQRTASAELRKLRLDDLSAGEWEGPAGRKPAPDNLDTVFGVAPCLLALTQGRRKAHKLFVKDGDASHRAAVVQVCEEAHRRGVPVQRVAKKDLDRMACGRVHQGVCLRASPLGYLSGDSAPGGSGEGATPLWLVLAGVQDPMNLGAILRSAYFLGVDRVASGLRDCCPLTPVVSKASSGIMEVIGVHGYEDLEGALRSKAQQGWELVGTVGAGAPQSRAPVTRCSDFRMSRPTLLLIGGEGGGLPPELLSLCHALLTVPVGRELAPGVESLNVSVATGILLHSMLSSRRSRRG